MSWLRLAVLYTALALGANPVLADIASLEALREGLMKKLQFHAEPLDISTSPFADEAGNERLLDEFRGQYVVLNFWATWCAPCRKEMPSLERLQTELGGEDFRVVTIATGRNTPAGIERFFAETEVTELPGFMDIDNGIADDMSVLGLPITVIINPEGQEIARMRGDAEWDTESAKAIISALIAGDG